MRNLFVCCLFIFQFIANNTNAQDVSLPLGPFRDFLISRYPSCFVNTNGNGELMLNTSCNAITAEDSLEFHNLGFFVEPLNLDGLQYFTSMIYLDCSNNQILNYVFPPNIQCLDVSSSMADQPFGVLPAVPSSVKKLIAKNNVASTIPFNAGMTYIDVSGNFMTSLPALPAGLDTLICARQGEPSYGRLTSLPALNASLKYLDCSENQLSSIPVLPATLKVLKCSSNKAFSNPEDYYPTLASIPALPAGLEYLDCSNNKINSLPALPTTLKHLNCSFQRKFEGDIIVSPIQPQLLHNIGISVLPVLPAGLTFLNCSRNNLTSLPALPPVLNYLNCSDNVYQYGGNTVTGIRCLPYLPNTLLNLDVEGTLVSCYPNNALGIPWPTLPLCNGTNNSNQCEAFPVLSGHLFYDNNSNGIMDAGENYRSNVAVTLGNGYQSFSNSAGYFELSGNLGVNTITISNPPFYNAVPVSISHTFSTYDTIVHDQIALQPTLLYDSLSVQLIPLNTMRPGFEFNYIVRYENIGTTVITPQINLNFNTSVLTFNNATNPAVVQNGNSLQLTDPSITTGTSKQFLASFTVNPLAVLGDTVRASVLATYGSGQSSTDSTYSVVRGSFDPNDKQATPSLTIAEVSSGTYIKYLVRFQNTGTDTAFNVVITDTLNTQLDAGSFEILQTSHLCKTTRSGHQLLFEFINIQLPDSNVNEPASHGYILFRVKPLTTVAANSVIPNKASIYFDFNAPIVTNAAQTYIQLGPVPLRLLRFKGSIEGSSGKVRLRWETSGESQTSHFLVERSFDAQVFQSVGMVRAMGTGNHGYNFAEPVSGKAMYYRLRMTDRNGSYSYSPVIRLSIDVSSDSWVILGNPAETTLRLHVLDAALAGTNARIINTQGLQLMHVRLKQGVQDLNLSSLPAGMYWIQAGGRTERFIKRATP